MIHSALAVTVWLSLLTATLLSLASLPFAGWIVFSGSRFAGLLESTLTLTLVLPPAVLGYLLLVLFSPENPLGRLTERLLGHPLPFSFLGLLVASLLYSLPFSVQPVAQAFRQIPTPTLETARMIGAPPLSTFFRVVVPQSLSGIATGWILGFAHTVGEFGVVMMVGGNIPGKTRTLSLKAYDDLLSMRPEGAWNSVLLLVAFSLASLFALNVVRGRSGRKDAAALSRG